MNKFHLAVFAATCVLLTPSFSQTLWRTMESLPIEFPLDSNDSCLLESDGEDFALLYWEDAAWSDDMKLFRLNSSAALDDEVEFLVGNGRYYYHGWDSRLDDFALNEAGGLWAVGSGAWGDAFLGIATFPNFTVEDLDRVVNNGSYSFYHGDRRRLRIVEGNGARVVSASPEEKTNVFNSEYGKVYVLDGSGVWSRSIFPGSVTISDLVFENETFAVAGRYRLSYSVWIGMVAFSQDGRTWAVQLVPGASDLHSLTWTGEAWIAGANDGVVLQLLNTSWNVHALPDVDAPITALTYANDTLVVGTESGDVYTSKDLLSWTHQIASETPIRTVASTSTHFACLSNSGFWVSPFSLVGTPDLVAMPSSRFIVPGEQVTLEVDAIGSGEIYYQWYRGESGDDSQPITGEQGKSYTTESLLGTVKLWVKASNSIGEDWSPTITLTMQTMPEITRQPSNYDYKINTTHRTMVDGELISPTYVTATGHNLSYQWFQGLSGDTSNPVGENIRQISLFSAVESERRYWVRVFNEVGSIDSRTALARFVCNPPVIREQPVDKSIEAGTRESISIRAEGSDLGYQWFAGESGDTSQPLAETYSSFSRSWTETGIFNFWVKIMNANGSVESRTVTVKVVPMKPPVITRHPTDISVYAGSTHELRVSVHGSELNYQWYSGESGDTSTPVGNSRSRLSLTPSYLGEYHYWVRVSNPAGFVDSSSAGILVQESSLEGILRQPLDFEVYRGGYNSDAPVLRVETSFAQASYQWYRGQTGDRSQPVVGANESVHIPSFLTAGEFQYWVEVNDGTVDYQSRSATVTVLPNFFLITEEPRDASALLGGSEWLSLKEVGDGNTFQWYVGQSGDTSTPLEGKTSPSYKPSTALAGEYEYWVRVSNGDDVINSRTIRFTVIGINPFITAEPSGGEIVLGDSISLSVSATYLVSPSFEWFRGESGDTSSPVPNEFNSNLSLNDLAIGRHRFWVRIRNSFGSTDSQTAIINVAPLGFASWANHYGLSTDRSVALQSSSGDGISDLMKYAIGLNPWLEYERPFEVESFAVREGNVFGMHIRMSNELNDLRLVVKESADLSHWDDAFEVGPRVDNGDGTSTTFFRFTDLQAPNGFLRLVAEDL